MLRNTLINIKRFFKTSASYENGQFYRYLISSSWSTQTIYKFNLFILKGKLVLTYTETKLTNLNRPPVSSSFLVKARSPGVEVTARTMYTKCSTHLIPHIKTDMHFKNIHRAQLSIIKRKLKLKQYCGVIT